MRLKFIEKQDFKRLLTGLSGLDIGTRTAEAAADQLSDILNDRKLPDGRGFWIHDDDMPGEETLKKLKNGDRVFFTPVEPKTDNQILRWDNATNIRLSI